MKNNKIKMRFSKDKWRASMEEIIRHGNTSLDYIDNLYNSQTSWVNKLDGKVITFNSSYDTTTEYHRKEQKYYIWKEWCVDENEV